jgi:hypothetical protein
VVAITEADIARAPMPKPAPKRSPDIVGGNRLCFRRLDFMLEFPVFVTVGVFMDRSSVPSIVPNGHDQNFYLVTNNYGNFGSAFAETDVSEADLETVVGDLMWPSRSTPPNIGLRMPRRMSRGKLCAVSISPGMNCRHRYRYL